MKIYSAKDRHKKLKELGFIHEKDGSCDPYGSNYVMRNGAYELIINCDDDVVLVNKNRDKIKLKVGNFSELKDVLVFIGIYLQ